jgi:hypothetical protein
MLSLRATGWSRPRREHPKDIDMDELTARRLRNVIPVLMEQRNIVVSTGASFAVHLIDLAIMQLRVTVNDVSEQELSEFSDVLSIRPIASEYPD